MSQRLSYTAANPVLFARQGGSKLKRNGIRVALVPFVLGGNISINFSLSTFWN